MESLHFTQKEQQLINTSLSPYPISIISTNRQLASQSSHHQQQYHQLEQHQLKQQHQQFFTCDETLLNNNI
ncbi:hypothetical protein Glove_494g35 [Diversispora epigaea]|uniref:Uncharacterized protein n=1 Tax=Diversispora epigaea TaxID=1348612 RepID=A0A397GNN1_9GLOM|nr:hypothetical protein Glove_494g34 [Diversispora epigaea]RHZ50633.1 hypothetical protein Glove_494g35 [Diversispora epigaea]